MKLSTIALTGLVLCSVLLSGCSSSSPSTAQPAASGTASQPTGAELRAQILKTDTIEKSIAFLDAKYGKTQRPEVTIIVDVETLKLKQNAIYQNAKDGMLLVKWSDLLVIYDPISSTVVKELATGSISG